MSTLDEQVAELMRLVSEACSAHIDLVLAQDQCMECQAEQAAAATACFAVGVFARAALERPTVPDGWQLVPIEPTLEMLEAGAEAKLFSPGKLSTLEVWRAMLDADEGELP